MPKPEADILLCSYRVSGRTWVRFMLSDCIARARGWDREVDLTNCFEWIPNWSWSERTGWGVFQRERLGPLPVIAAAHDRFGPILRGHRIVWLYRDPMDILTSRFSRRSPELADADLARYLEVSSDALSYAEWINSWASGLEKHKDYCLLRYEDLIEDRGREIDEAHAAVDDAGVEGRVVDDEGHAHHLLVERGAVVVGVVLAEALAVVGADDEHEPVAEPAFGDPLHHGLDALVGEGQLAEVALAEGALRAREIVGAMGLDEMHVAEGRAVLVAVDPA